MRCLRDYVDEADFPTGEGPTFPAAPESSIFVRVIAQKADEALFYLYVNLLLITIADIGLVRGLGLHSSAQHGEESHWRRRWPVHRGGKWTRAAGILDKRARHVRFKLPNRRRFGAPLWLTRYHRSLRFKEGWSLPNQARQLRTCRYHEDTNRAEGEKSSLRG